MIFNVSTSDPLPPSPSAASFHSPKIAFLPPWRGPELPLPMGSLQGEGTARACSSSWKLGKAPGSPSACPHSVTQCHCRAGDSKPPELPSWGEFLQVSNPNLSCVHSSKFHWSCVHSSNPNLSFIHLSKFHWSFIHLSILNLPFINLFNLNLLFINVSNLNLPFINVFNPNLLFINLCILNLFLY